MTNPHESLVHRHTLDNQILGKECHETSRIQFCGFVNPDLDLWIQFRTWLLNYSFWGFVSEEQKVKRSICIDLEQFMCKSRILRNNAKKLNSLNVGCFCLNFLILDVFTFVCKNLYFHFKFQTFLHFMLKKVTILKIDQKCKHCNNIKWTKQIIFLVDNLKGADKLYAP
jgi:hypothetical protein